MAVTPLPPVGLRYRWHDAHGPVIAVAAAAICIALVALGMQGVDWPAQIYRVELFRADPFGVWNANWYGGHATPTYSLLFPALGALVGASVVGAASVAGATVCFDRIVARIPGTSRSLATPLFALSAVSSFAIGQLTFLLGAAFALAAVLALQHRQPVVAIALGACAAAASPVAGAFLLIAIAAWMAAGLVDRGRIRRDLMLTTVVVAALMIAVRLVFPEWGPQPFDSDAIHKIGIVCAVALVVFRARHRPLVAGIAIYGLIVVAAMVIANPLGNNLERLSYFLAPAIIATAAVGPNKRVIHGMAIAVLAWPLMQSHDVYISAPRDASHEESFYAPLEALLTNEPTNARIEIPFTHWHWEAAYVASQYPLARGWLRQLDRARNPLFYRPTLSEDSYSRWLKENSVRWVALPNTPLDYSSQLEAALLEGSPAYLRPVMNTPRWRVWEFRYWVPIVAAPAQQVDVGASEIHFRAPSPGPYRVQVRGGDRWRIAEGRGCVATAGDDALIVRASAPGPMVVKYDPFRKSPCKSA